MPQIVGDSIDRLCSVEIRYKAVPGGLPRGVTTKLYEAARRENGAPLTYSAASALLDRVAKDDRVFVLCGSGSPPHLAYGETDGPLGGASIIRAIELGLGAKPIVISEKHIMGPNRATIQAAGITIHEQDVFEARPHSALAIEFPYGFDTGPHISQLFDEHRPKAVIFVERTGPNADGIFHSVTGSPKKPEEVVASHLFAAEAKERGILTIGVGDGGNEVGFGRIYDEAREIQAAPVAMTVTETDILVAASISNWGAYGIAAMLGYLLEKPELVQDPDMEYRMLNACIAAGGADGAFTSPVMYVDGTSWQTQQAIVTILRETVANALIPLVRAF
jgi:D-glutamate cyclase